MVKVQTNSQGKVYVANGKAILAKELGTKSITANGTYNASSDSLDGYSSVTVNVSGGGGVGIPREVSQQGVYQMPSNNFTFSLPINATDVGDYTLHNAFSGCTGLTSVNLSSLTSITGDYALYNAFSGCTNLTSVDLSNLTIIDADHSVQTFCAGCTSLTSVDLSSLTTIGLGGFINAFNGCISLTSLSFPALTTPNSTSQWTGMLDGVTGCTVHFPMNLQSTMSSWSSVTSGFSGTNTTVLFDLGGCTTTFSITPSSGNRIVVNGEELTGTDVILEKESTALYQAYNSSYGLYISSYSVPDADTDTVTIDLTGITYNTISIDTSVSGLTVTANIDGTNNYTLTEVGSTGVYTLDLYKNTGSNISVSYLVNGGGSYADVSGTLTFNNADITETVTMQPAVDVTFTRPNLTANGTMGGNAFAVQSGTSTTAYNAVDSSSSSYATVNSGSGYTYIFYNPDALKVSGLGITFRANTYSATAVTVEGSNDNSNWTSIATWSGSAGTYADCTVNSSTYYKYHKLTLTPYGTSIRISDLAITAVYKG